ncbi:MAG: SDR family oxidoreductase [Bacteroidia bacterium]|nr:SDR family oxidoreductase [Bacteroidia bacterium]MDW8334629.1 SDR family oxidoreductase [Bacteroidia bacterium]
MRNKTVVVTGANTGIGKVTALELARMGAKVVMLCRNREKGEAALAEIKRLSANDEVEMIVADLGAKATLKRFAEHVCARYSRLDVLINNAGGLWRKYTETADGHETTFGVNHLGHFYLTHLLTPMLLDSAPSRIVNVSSEFHRFARTVNFEDIMGKNNYNAWYAYAQSKLCNILFTYRLAEMFKNTGVTANCLHPGAVGTEFARELPVWVRKLFNYFAVSPEKGARTSVYLASSPHVETTTGKYFVARKPRKSSPASYNVQLQKRLWKLSEELCGIS